jgi:hypothetical protein
MGTASSAALGFAGAGMGMPGGAPSVSDTSSVAQTAKINTTVPFDLATGAGNRGFENNVAFPGSTVIGSTNSGGATAASGAPVASKAILWILGGTAAVLLVFLLIKRKG